MTPASLSLLADHVWQSTVCVGIVWLLIFALQTSQARVRYALWLAASIKFLIPFAVLVAIGGQVGWRSSAHTVQPQVTFAVIDVVSQPFTRPEITAMSAPVSARTMAILPMLLFAIWAVGCAMHLLAWSVRWRGIAEIAEGASTLDAGRELEALRRLEELVGLRQPVGLVFCDMACEPAVFGIWKPVLLWPRSLSDRLVDGEIDAILAHELCHVRRRDNLAVALHMAVEAVFWFHPLMWWLERRLIDERERACDEDVIRLGSNPQLYAESILKTCKFYAESPLACVAGVTGSELKSRIEAIMRGHRGEPLTTWRRFLLAVVAIAVVSAPVVVGALNAPKVEAQGPAADHGSAAFEVASIKPNKSGDRLSSIPYPVGDRFTATNVSLRELVAFAYQFEGNNSQTLLGGPDWIRSDRFDVQAKAESTLPPWPPGGAPQPLLLMVRTLLAERFRLVVHQETRELPIYALILARNDGKLGSRLHATTIDCGANAAAIAGGGPAQGLPQPAERRCGMRIGPGQIVAGGIPLSQLGIPLSQFAQRNVIDRTGLTGAFDLDLSWTPARLPQGPPPPGAPPLPPVDPSGPSIFTALQEQLGLKLDATRGPVDVLVIDRVERPSDDAALVNKSVPQLAAKQIQPSGRLNAAITTGKTGSGTPQIDAVDFCCPDYLRLMVDRIGANWVRHAEVAGTTAMRFSIQRDGRISDVVLERSSGVQVLDVNSEQALLMTNTLNPLPAEFPNPTLTVHLNFKYQR